MFSIIISAYSLRARMTSHSYRIPTGHSTTKSVGKILMKKVPPFLTLKSLRIIAALGLFLSMISAAAAARSDDPLPSWNSGDNKTAIIDFVDQVTREGGPEFVSPSRRIAVFDNDGCLWSEQPVYFQVFYIVDRVKELAPQHPEWQNEEPFSSVLKGDFKTALAGGEEALLKMMMATHAGLTASEFSESVDKWLKTARHPKTNMLYPDMVFQPMLELLDYLRANDFKVFIVSGGGIDFLRVFAEDRYGVPPEFVVGSSIKSKYEVRDGVPVIVKLPEIDLIDDKAGKPVGIHRYIGQRPIFAFGNSDGDYQMLEFTTAGEGLRFSGLVHHDDGKREWAYDRESHVGKLVKGLDEGPTQGWRIISMKNDWKQIYPETP